MEKQQHTYYITATMVPILGIKFSPADKVTGIYMFMSMSWDLPKDKATRFLQQPVATEEFGYNSV